MSVEQTAKQGVDGKYHDEWAVTVHKDYAERYEIKPHRIKVQIELTHGRIWLGTGDNAAGARLNAKEIDELVTVLLYVKTLI